MNTPSMTRRELSLLAPLFMGLSLSGLRGGTAAAEESNDGNTTYVIFEMDITFETMYALHDTVLNAMRKGSRNIVLMINSFGGNISAAVATHHFLLALPIKLTTYNMADVSSAALLVFLAGSTRIANTSARFGFHSASRALGKDRMSAVELSQGAAAMAAENTRMKEIYKSRLTVDDSYYDTLFNTEITSVKAPEALKIGLIGSIDELHIDEKSKIFFVPQLPAPKPATTTALAPD